MSKQKEHERNTTLDLLADLVDDDIRHQHLPGMLTLPVYALILSVTFCGVVFLWLSAQSALLAQSGLATALAQSAQSLSVTYLLGATATFGVAMTLRYSALQILDDNGRIERFRRICRQSRFKSINNPRNELLLFSLLYVSDVLPIPLRKAMVEIPDEFREERLLRHLLEPQ